jgi:hypothetical protein
MGKGACGVDRVKVVPFEGGRRDGEEKKEGRLKSDTNSKQDDINKSRDLRGQVV